LLIGTHVDDIFPLCNPEGEKIRTRVLLALKSKVEVEDKGEIKYALDMHIERDAQKGTLCISQKNYIDGIINEFQAKEAIGKDTPAPADDIKETDAPITEAEKQEALQFPVRNAIGKLWWAALVSRPDILCALHKCATWQNTPSLKLWLHIMWIIKYLKTTRDQTITYRRQQEGGDTLYAFCDASFGAERNSKSRTGHFFCVLGALIAWTSVHTTRVVTSSTEAECHAIVQVLKENRWIKEFIQELNVFKIDKATTIYQDNKSAISLTQNKGQHKRSKHFGIEFDAVRESVREGEIEVKYLDTQNMPADMLTKSLGKAAFNKHKEVIMGGRGIEGIVSQQEAAGRVGGDLGSAHDCLGTEDQDQDAKPSTSQAKLKPKDDDAKKPKPKDQAAKKLKAKEPKDQEEEPTAKPPTRGRARVREERE